MASQTHAESPTVISGESESVSQPFSIEQYQPDVIVRIGDADRLLLETAFQISIDGLSLTEHEHRLYERFVYYFDRNNDGVLSGPECERLPHPHTIQSQRYSPLVPSPRCITPSDASQLAGTDSLKLMQFYRNKGVRLVTLQWGIDRSSTILDAVLGKLFTSIPQQLGTTGDWQADALQLFRDVDANCDEIISAAELKRDIIYPSPDGLSTPAPSSHDVLEGDAVSKRFYLQWNDDEDSLSAWPKECSPWQVSLVTEHVDRGLSRDTLIESNAVTVAETSFAKIAITARPPDSDWRSASARRRMSKVFQAADLNADQLLNQEELLLKSARLPRGILKIVDRSEDGQIDMQEWTSWCDFWSAIVDCQVDLAVVLHPEGLFERIDHDANGELSWREWKKAAGLVARASEQEDQLDIAARIGLVRVTIGLSGGTSLIGKPRPVGPGWFIAADRNEDRELSPEEFVGSLQSFTKLDTDHDGRLSMIEATTFSSANNAPAR